MMPRMCDRAKEMLQKARQPKHGGYKTILEKWHKDDKYRKSLSDIGWIENRSNKMTQLHWRIIPMWLQQQKEVGTRNPEKKKN